MHIFAPALSATEDPDTWPPDHRLPDWPLLLTDPDPRVRQAAIDLLVDSGERGYPEFLELALYDTHPGVREAAAEALEELAAAGL